MKRDRRGRGGGIRRWVRDEEEGEGEGWEGEGCEGEEQE